MPRLAPVPARPTRAPRRASADAPVRAAEPAAASAPAPAPAPAPARAPRRSQEERRSQTRLRLCEAAVELLAEIGYERLTTALIAQRAQVSKGAQAYHFPSKDDMLVAAFQHLLDGWQARREEFRRHHPGTATVEQLLRYLWRDVFGRADYVASVEMMLAARHHPALRQRLQAVLATWTVARDDIFRQLVPLDDHGGQLATFLQLNFCVLRGLALFGGLNADPALEQRVLQMWIGMAADFVAARSRPAARPRPRTATASGPATRPST